jgi:hypothetical protein
MGSAARASMRRPTVLGHLIAVAGVTVALLLGGCGSGSSTDTSASGSGAPTDFFGVDPGVAPDAQDFQQMSHAQVASVRLGLNWAAVQPIRGPYNWRLPDSLISGLAAEGIGYLPVLSTTPGWVAPQATTPPLASSQASESWAQFLKAAVERYGPHGSFWRPAPDGGASPFHTLCRCNADPRPITSWQVWNEPSLTHYFTAPSPVTSYAKLLQISHDAITSVDPQAQIVLAGVPGFAAKGGLDAWQFLGELFQVPGVNNNFDVVALHPYARDVDQLEMEIKKVRAVMKENGDEAKPLWITELGWGSDPPDRFGFNKGVDGQEHLLTQSFTLLLRERAAWNIGRVYWFEWRDPPSSAQVGCSFCTSAGLLRNNRQPKPAYDAYTHFTVGQSN